LHERLAELPDNTIVHPTHGGGSFCSTGGGDSAAGGAKGRSTTLGTERNHNPLFQVGSEDAFVETLVAGYGLFPPYFLQLREVNRRGPGLLDDAPSPSRLEPGDVQQELTAGAWAVDVRRPERYASGHLHGAVAVPPDRSFAVRLGWVIPFGTRLVLIAEDEAAAAKATMKAAGIGYENVAGWITFDQLRDADLPVSQTPLVDARELATKLKGPDPPTVVDVRNPPEWADGKVPGALTIEFGALRDEIPPVLRRGPVITYCASGARAALAASLLERAGQEDVTIFPGGPEEWRASGRPLEPR
jgi:rhodanese-related sulfurtransferase